MVRVKYHAARGPCYRGLDGSWAMPKMDWFNIVEVISGHLKADHIEVRPRSSKGRLYPKGLVEGAALTIRLRLSDESLKQAEENEQRGDKWLIVNGVEVEQITPL